LQYATGAPTDDEFFPSTYNYLSKILREEGHEDEADRVLSEKLTVEKLKLSRFARWKSERSLQGRQEGEDHTFRRKLAYLGLLLLAPYWLLRFVFWWLARKLFNYGLSVVRTLSTFIILVLIGWGAAYVADHGLTRFHIKPVLVVEANAVNTVAVPVSKATGPEDITTGFPLANGVLIREIPCGNRIEPFTYAFTTFVPILDLHEEKVCEISQEAGAAPWRIGKFVYSLLGWIVSSVTLLTLPGFLRAKAEK